MKHALRATSAPRPSAAKPQPRLSISDQVDRLTPEWDDITARARLGTGSVRDYEALEEMAQAFAGKLVAVFRGRSLLHPAPRVSADGTSVGG